MALFSQRAGIRPLVKPMQRKELDLETRNRIWSIMHFHVIKQYSPYGSTPLGNEVEKLMRYIWHNYWKLPMDEVPDVSGSSEKIKIAVLKNKWHMTFDLLEIFLQELPTKVCEPFSQDLNLVLTEENSAYRVVGENIIEITNESELAEIQLAAETQLQGVNTHVEAAIRLLSDRKQPDYRNSIKESISAVESLFKIITKKPSATLGEGLKAVKDLFGIHPALMKAFDNLYGYTSDEKGIRHAIFDSQNTSHSDAKFMLVTCSAFINYVLGKYAEAGKELPK